MGCGVKTSGISPPPASSWMRLSEFCSASNCSRERIFMERMASACRLEASKERARNEGSTGPKRLDDTRYITYRRCTTYRRDLQRRQLLSRVQGAGFRVQGTGCRVQGAGCRVRGSGFRRSALCSAANCSQPGRYRGYSKLRTRTTPRVPLCT